MLFQQSHVSAESYQPLVSFFSSLWEGKHRGFFWRSGSNSSWGFLQNPSVSPPWSEFLTTSLTESAWLVGTEVLESSAKPAWGAAPLGPCQEALLGRALLVSVALLWQTDAEEQQLEPFVWAKRQKSKYIYVLLGWAPANIWTTSKTSASEPATEILFGNRLKILHPAQHFEAHSGHVTSLHDFSEVVVLLQLSWELMRALGDAAAFYRLCKTFPALHMKSLLGIRGY